MRATRTIGATISLLFLSACVPIFSVGTGTYYSIEKLWSDKNYLYVLYEKRSGLEGGSILNVHGGWDITSKKLYYKKIERSALAENMQIDLSDGMSAGNLKYVDEDFTLEEGGAFHSEKRYVTNRSGRIEVPCDKEESRWADGAVSRVDDMLFYCGNVIRVTGGEIRKLPGNVTEKLKAFSGLDLRSTPMFSRNGREGSVLVRILGGPSGKYLELDALSLEIKEEGNFPPGRIYFRDYSERGFLYHGEENYVIWVCDSGGCRKFRGPANNRSFFASGADNKVYALVFPEGENPSGPLVKIKELTINEMRTEPN